MRALLSLGLTVCVSSSANPRIAAVDVRWEHQTVNTVDQPVAHTLQPKRHQLARHWPSRAFNGQSAEQEVKSGMSVSGGDVRRACLQPWRTNLLISRIRTTSSTGRCVPPQRALRQSSLAELIRRGSCATWYNLGLLRGRLTSLA